jgi:CheY-like chemotaxis protein
MINEAPIRPLNILLADDDIDDRFFFGEALKELPYDTTLKTAQDGEKLLTYLRDNTDDLPDVIFLDLNMPRKNGAECLLEIKLNEDLQHLPVIIYSTSLHDNIADLLYSNGAYYYILKNDFPVLLKNLDYILGLIVDNKLERPHRSAFVPLFA